MPENTKITILVVDDDAQALDIYSDIIEDLGHTVFKAKDGYEALQVLEKNKNSIDLIILDLMMPGVPGTEVLDRIRAEADRYGSPKIIVLSALSNDKTIKYCFERNISGYLLKPEVTEEDIKKEIERVITDGRPKKPVA